MTPLNIGTTVNGYLETSKEDSEAVKENVKESSATVKREHRIKLVVGLLAIFLGVFGVHKFYLGKVGQGIVYLLFCWTGIPTIVGSIEGLIYLVVSLLLHQVHTSGRDVEARYVSYS